MLRPIEKVIKSIEAADEKQLDSQTAYEAVMYLEMLHDLMADTAYYFSRYAECNLPRKERE